MHGGTEAMVNYLVAALAERGIQAQKFELSTTDIGKLAMALVDAATRHHHRPSWPASERIFSHPPGQRPVV